MNTKIDLHDIARLQDDFFLARIRRIMRDAIIERQPRGEAKPRLETTSTFKAGIVEQRSHAIFDSECNLR